MLAVPASAKYGEEITLTEVLASEVFNDTVPTSGVFQQQIIW
jgi:hypothetical protein